MSELEFKKYKFHRFTKHNSIHFLGLLPPLSASSEQWAPVFIVGDIHGTGVVYYHGTVLRIELELGDTQKQKIELSYSTQLEIRYPVQCNPNNSPSSFVGWKLRRREQFIIWYPISWQHFTSSSVMIIHCKFFGVSVRFLTKALLWQFPGLSSDVLQESGERQTLNSAVQVLSFTFRNLCLNWVKWRPIQLAFTPFSLPLLLVVGWDCLLCGRLEQRSGNGICELDAIVLFLETGRGFLCKWEEEEEQHHYNDPGKFPVMVPTKSWWQRRKNEALEHQLWWTSTDSTLNGKKYVLKALTLTKWLKE